MHRGIRRRNIDTDHISRAASRCINRAAVEMRTEESLSNTHTQEKREAEQARPKPTMGALMLLHVLLVAVAARAPAAQAWGKEGHYMVCKIAEVPVPERSTSHQALDFLLCFVLEAGFVT